MLHGQQQQQQQQQHGATTQRPPSPPNAPAPPPPPAAAAAELSGELLSLVLSAAAPLDLCAARCVCRVWRWVASDPQVRRASFVRFWRLLAVHGLPRSQSFYEQAGLAGGPQQQQAHAFVRAHAVRRGDTLAALAVRHGVTVAALKRANNLISEHSLHARALCYVPCRHRRDVEGQVAAFRYDPHCQREFAVVETTAAAAAAAAAAVGAGGGGDGAAAAAAAAAQDADADDGGGDEDDGGGRRHPHGDAAEAPPRAAAAMTARLCRLLGRGLRVDDATAAFYLREAGGDLKAAMHEFQSDLEWEQDGRGGGSLGPGVRLAPVGRFIRGEAV